MEEEHEGEYHFEEPHQTHYKEFKYLEDVGFPRCDYGTCVEGTMLGWYQKSSDGSIEMVAHWLTFGTMVLACLYLGHCTWTNRGPSGRHRWFSGYNEQFNLSLYVNFFAAIAYFGKSVADYEVCSPQMQRGVREWKSEPARE